MDRREAGEELYRKKFAECGLDAAFDFIKRDWNSDHGRKMIVRCKSCGSVFSIWNEVFKGRQSRMYCKGCGAASDGATCIKARSPRVEEAMRFYSAGHSVRETADLFGFSKVDINNFAKRRKISNGRDWQSSGTASWRAKARQLFASGRVKQNRSNRWRANKYGCEYDPTISLKKLIERDGMRCALCGGMCDANDQEWNNGIGPLYPTIDHIIPMSKKGGHVWSNVQIAHAVCNYRKGARTEEVNA